MRTKNEIMKEKGAARSFRRRHLRQLIDSPRPEYTKQLQYTHFAGEENL